jgi:serine/threonine-protein kinase
LCWAAAALLAAALLAACGPTGAQPVTEVTVHVPGQAAQSARLPAYLDRAGLVPGAAVTYRLDAEVTLAPRLRGQRLILVIPSLSARARASADGEKLVVVRGDETAGYRVRPPLAWAVPPRLTADGHLGLSVAVDHTWSQSAWITAAPELVPPGEGLGRATWVDRVNLPIATASFVVIVSIGLLMIWVSLVDRRSRTSRLFAVQALTAAFAPAQVLGLTIFLGPVEIPLMASMVVLSITFAQFYTAEFFGRPAPSRAWWWACAACVSVIWMWSSPFQASDVGVPACVGYLTVGLVAVNVRVLSLPRTSRSWSTWLYLATWSTLAVTAPPDMLAWVGLADLLGGARTSVVGLLLFPFMLELLLNRQQLTTLNHANSRLAHQVDDLERHRTEIETLNLELRRQVAERATQLHAALLLSNRGAQSAPVLAAGEIVQERYRVVRPVGSGGMGTVYEVERLSDQRRLALKLAREVSGEALARMAREAQTALAVAHPNVVTMVDVDVSSAGFLYLVMELVDGTSLAQVRERFGRRDFALPVLAQLADGLAALHEKSVLHRDLKPANVLLAASTNGAPLVKISDFGIALVPEPLAEGSVPGLTAALARVTTPPPGTEAARVTTPPPGAAPATAAATPREGDAEPSLPSSPLPPVPAAFEPTHATRAAPAPPKLPPGPKVGPFATWERAHGKGREGSSDGGLTRTGFLPGTPAYMAPELGLGREHLSLAADLFAFGVIARELLVNKRPFAEPPVQAALEGREPPETSPLVADWHDAPPALAELLDRCLAIAPSRRPQAAELARALAPWR